MADLRRTMCGLQNFPNIPLVNKMLPQMKKQNIITCLVISLAQIEDSAED